MIPRLQLRGIQKRFGSVQALRGADFTLGRGELHALLGENGAGKTTLMHVAFGMIQPDRGEILIDGVPTRIPSPRMARRLKIGMVHQHFTSLPALTVAENLALAAGWAPAGRELEDRTLRLMSEVGLRLEPGARVEELSVGLKQRLEILKALSGGADILLLDEPAGVLAPAESAELLSLVQAFTRRGGSAVLITHKLDDALQWADRVTVIRRGTTVFSGSFQSSEGPRLAELMVGETSALLQGVRSVTGVLGPMRVSCEDLEVAPAGSASTGVRSATLSIRAGEIVGIAAVEGNGQRELLRATAGLVPPSAGRLEVNGRVGFVPEDRTTEGLIPDLTLAENVALGLGAAGPWVRGPWLNWRQVRNQTTALIAEFNIQAPDADTRAGALSGGNQQKLMIARVLAGHPAVLVIENPTRGLDFRATAEIRRRLQEAAASGIAILFYSSDLDEVLELSSRIVVLARGATITAPPGADKADIGALMLGATTESGHRA